MKKYIFKQSFAFFKENDELTEQELNNSFSHEFIERLITGDYLVEKKDELPKTWEELKLINGYYVDEICDIEIDTDLQTHRNNKNVFPTEEEAKASIALAQLCQLRDRYNDDWKPDWESEDYKYCIFFGYEILIVSSVASVRRVLAFKSEELADKFLENFQSLIEIAKPLL